METVSDGQHAFGKSQRCFFCLKQKSNCSTFGVERKPNMDYSKWEDVLDFCKGKLFVCCAECSAKGQTYLLENIVEHLRNERMIARIAERKARRRR